MTDLIFEVTRRCNMNCGFCLRGDAENRDMPYSVISKVLSQISERDDYLPCITFTGGEPSLQAGVRRILHTLDVVKNYGISVESFYITTNAKQENIKFMDAIIDWYCYCDSYNEDDHLYVEISNSFEHSRQGQDSRWMKKLMALRFVKQRTPLEKSYGYIAEGRGVEFCELSGYIDDAKRVEVKNEIPTWEAADHVYINIHGDVLLQCDSSCENQHKHKIGNIFKTNIYDMFTQEEDQDES